MTFFGKFLAVLNLGALCGFFYLAVVDFQMRQAWAYANFRWDLALDGFPVDQEEPDARKRLEAMKKERKAPRLEEELRALLDDRIKMLKELPLAPVKKDQLGKKQAIARALLGFLDVLPTDEEKKQQAVERSRPLEQRSD